MTDLLKVLDMSEDEQRAEIAKYLSTKPFKHDWGFSNAVGGSDNIATGEAWVCRKCGHEEIYNRIKSGQYIPAVLDKQFPECNLPDPIQESLADLAFRLRDEVVKIDGDGYLNAMCTIAEHREGVCVCDKCYNKTRKGKMMDWWADSKPIDWIIAALIAKEKANE